MPLRHHSTQHITYHDPHCCFKPSYTRHRQWATETPTSSMSLMQSTQECLGSILLPLEDSERSWGSLFFTFCLCPDGGYDRKQEGPSRGALTPFDCCSLSFQPFNHPVCARNDDGTGNVFELTNIIPWLKCVQLALHTSNLWTDNLLDNTITRIPSQRSL